MRWMWIDTIVTYEPDKRLVAIKNVSLAEEHLHEHFRATATLPAQPVMPASLMIEGMAQTAGGDFRHHCAHGPPYRAVGEDWRDGNHVQPCGPEHERACVP